MCNNNYNKINKKKKIMIIIINKNFKKASIKLMKIKLKFRM